MDIVLQIAEKIWTKYRSLLIPLYGIVGLYFMYIVGTYVLERNNKDYVFDRSFISKQIEKINYDVKDFKYSDVPYIDMVCKQYSVDYFMQRNCKIINSFLDKKGYKNDRSYQ